MAGELAKIVEQLKTQRDELRVRLHLAKADARDEWEALEKRWEHLRAETAVVGREAGHAAGDVGAATRLLLEEIQRGYQRIRALL
ncbi:MAG: hypothetical protein KIT14_03030 [bacterium]|nr:hypothetical protein [bacterium]